MLDRARIGTEMRDALQRHVAEAWFPRCLDKARGGYLCDFDRQWRPDGSQDRMLEFQARQTCAAARLALFYPREPAFSDYALHGAKYLQETLWDRKHGGWFWLVSREGTPKAAATKHAHSTAYAVQALALVYRATGHGAALELANEGFVWLDRHAHDEVHGGYHGWLRQDGTVIHSSAEVPVGAGTRDPLGHGVGLKDVNVQGDWFEALLDLSSVSSDPLVKIRLDELGAIYLEHLTTPAGEVQYAFHRDWTPQPGLERFGYGFQAVHRLIAASHLVRAGAALEARAESVLTHTLSRARHDSGGFRYAGPADVITHLEDSDIRVHRRAWWVQLEALRALAVAATRREASPSEHGQRFARQWAFVQQSMFDARYGGVFATCPDDLPRWQRPWVPRDVWALRKGNRWKDASHETHALVSCLGLLRAEAIA